jgi:hypothetical protein
MKVLKLLTIFNSEFNEYAKYPELDLARSTAKTRSLTGTILINDAV